MYHTHPKISLLQIAGAASRGTAPRRGAKFKNKTKKVEARPD